MLFYIDRVFILHVRYRLVAQRLKDLEDRSTGDNAGNQQLTEEVINQEAGELAAESLAHENRDTEAGHHLQHVTEELQQVGSTRN